MNPYFSHDGQTLLYSAGKSFADYDLTAAMAAVESDGEYYEQHSIWEYDMATGQNTRITDTGFAMWPRYIDRDRAICFVRRNGDAFDLYVYKDGVERLAVAGIPESHPADQQGFFNLTPLLSISS
jgi:Tol biopolymer transport system component